MCKRRLCERSFDFAQDKLLRSNLLRNKQGISSSRKKRGIRKYVSAYLATWAPDGNTLVFSSDRTGRAELFIVRRDGPGSSWTQPEQLTSDGGFWPSWSSVLGEIVYRSDPLESIRILDPTTGESRELAPGEAGVTRPEWSADGTTVYYGERGDDDIFSIWSISAQGGPARELVRFDDLQRRFPAPNFAVGETQFLFFINQFESDVWVVELGGNE